MTTTLRDTNRKKSDKGSKQNVIHCYLMNNLTKRGHRKILVEIWAESEMKYNRSKTCSSKKNDIKEGLFFVGK